jgi:hypothetical protein
MQLSFLPGELFLKKTSDGTFVITIQGEEVFKSKIEKKAITEYNRIRKDMEGKYPARELTPEEKSEALRKWMMDAKITEVRNSTRKEKPDKIKGTRTFG